MKQIFIAAIYFALPIFFTSCGGKEPANDQQSLMEVSKQELAEALAERDQLLLLVKEISTGMERIGHLENLLALRASNPDDNPSSCSVILKDIQILERALHQRRQKLEQLEEKMQESGRYNEELEGVVTALRKQIDAQNAEISDLRRQLVQAREQITGLCSEVDSLNNTVQTVTSDRDRAMSTSALLEDELNTCYYVVASKSELKEHQILETGFLRKSRLMQGDFDRDFFSAADKRDLHEIEIGSSKAKVLTSHPDGCYEISGDNHNKVMRIIDPERFWSLSNYLVIQKN